MISWTTVVNFSFALCGLLVAALGLFLSRSVSHLDRRSRRFFLWVFALIVAYNSSDLLSTISIDFLGPSFSTFSRISVFAESFFSSLLMPLLTLYLLYCVGLSWKLSPFTWTVAALWGVYLALLLLTQFTTEIYFITEENVYQRGPWYPVLLLSPILLMLVNLYLFFRHRKKLSSGQRRAFSAYLLIPLVCMLIQAFSYGLLMIVIGTSVGTMLMFIFILREQTGNYLRQQEENVRQRNNIMVLQMRPHFIYNTMTSIYYLIKQDPDRAQQVTLDFTSYLRRNFTAVAREDTIPFSEEMEHTRAYLAVEQVRFEGKLSVSFDTPHTAFRLPPLTLQPVVENAVKYGVDPDLDPLTITVRTRQTGRGNEITIEDTGPGFGVPDSREPHIALDNIRERLMIICGGSLSIASRDGGGTIVTILIP